MEQEKLNKYNIQKITPGQIELKGYLHQLLSFIDKRSFLELAAVILDYMDNQALGNIYELNNEQVKSILEHFEIMPEYLYYHKDDPSAEYESIHEDFRNDDGDEQSEMLEILPIFYSSCKEVIMAKDSLLFLHRAGGCILDVISESGKKLVIPGFDFDDFEPMDEDSLIEQDSEYLDIPFMESDYFDACKISSDKRSIHLSLLGRMTVWVEFLYENQQFIFNGSVNYLNNDNLFELSDIDTEYENYLKDKEAIKNAPHSVKIFNQTWITRNLDVTHFKNGDIIPKAQTSEEWDDADLNKRPAWCYYNNSELNGEKYGKLYNWYAVNDPRGLAPQGWHIPSLDEWEQLAQELGEDGNIKIQGGRDWVEDTEMKIFFSSLFNREDETDEEAKIDLQKHKFFNQTGLTILPAGGRGRFGNVFYGKGDSAFFWTSTPFDSNEESSNEAYFVLIHVADSVMQSGNYTERKVGFSVRCIKD